MSALRFPVRGNSWTLRCKELGASFRLQADTHRPTYSITLLKYGLREGQTHSMHSSHPPAVWTTFVNHRQTRTLPIAIRPDCSLWRPYSCVQGQISMGSYGTLGVARSTHNRRSPIHRMKRRDILATFPCSEGLVAPFQISHSDQTKTN
jgi:hypothetical protein